MGLKMRDFVACCEAAVEPTRLRIVALLDVAELTVSDLTEILGQTQPRVSRHLRILVEANIVRRTPQGAWAYFRRARSGDQARAVDVMLGLIDRDDHEFAADARRLAGIRAEHSARSTEFFDRNAAEWERLRALHVADGRVEREILAAVQDRHPASVLDLGTGTGRILELLGSSIERGVGIDNSPNMLAVARHKLESAGLRHCTVRHGDIQDVGYPPDTFDLVIIHQVLHVLDEPSGAIDEAARVLTRGGSVVVVDFAIHDQTVLITEHHHRRLGFSKRAVTDWMKQAGLGAISHSTLAPESEQSIAISIWIGRDRRPKPGLSR